MRVLVVEDELKMAGLIRRGMREQGLVADVVPNGEDAMWMAQATPYDAIVLDVMLPGIDGFETCRRLRGEHVWTPVLMLTARDGVEDRVQGLDTGADDYLVKPFSFAGLLARLPPLARPRAGGPPARAGAPRAGRAAGRPACRGPASRPGVSARLARRDRHRTQRQRVRPPRGLHAPSGPHPRPLSAPRARVGLHVREPVQRDRGLRPLPAREGRPAVRGRVDRDGPRRRVPAARRWRAVIDPSVRFGA